MGEDDPSASPSMQRARVIRLAHRARGRHGCTDDQDAQAVSHETRAVQDRLLGRPDRSPAVDTRVRRSPRPVRPVLGLQAKKRGWGRPFGK